MASSHHNQTTNSTIQFFEQIGQKQFNKRATLIFSILILVLAILLSACSSDEATRKSRSGRWTKADDGTTLVVSSAGSQIDRDAAGWLMTV